jgi:hypothetical protein
MDCEMCVGMSRTRPATQKVTYGLYAVLKTGRPHRVIYLCSECSHDLWEGIGYAGPLKSIVTAGLCYYEIGSP